MKYRLVLQDNYQKIQNTESKQKRPRKKPKPAALTRPPKKGKKKKKKTQRRNVRPQEPVPPAETLKNPEPGMTVHPDTYSPYWFLVYFSLLTFDYFCIILPM